MAAPKGHARYGGRQKGVPNKATADIKAVARELSPAATKRLAELLKSDNESVALGAVKEIYDRAYGKASQTIVGDDENPVRMIQEIVLRGVRSDANDRHS